LFVKFRNNADVVFMCVFLGEMLLKLAAFGVDIYSKKSYFRGGWNCLDFVIVLGGLLEYMPFGSRFVCVLLWWCVLW
jgi:hypothetical protein